MAESTEVKKEMMRWPAILMAVGMLLLLAGIPIGKFYQGSFLAKGVLSVSAVCLGLGILSTIVNAIRDKIKTGRSTVPTPGPAGEEKQRQ